jgi:hypothetical protein
MRGSDVERSACEAAIAAQDVAAIAAMLDPDAVWYGEHDRLRGQGSEAVLDYARDRIASRVLSGAELTSWERFGDHVVIGVRLAAEGRPERVFLCRLVAGRIVEVRDCASRDEAVARLGAR